VRGIAMCLLTCALTARRSDNDMYHHMNNSVYYYLYAFRSHNAVFTYML
jgi:hypothetical protein